MFKVKAVVVDFLGDKDKYPCHQQHKMGDEFFFDGESFSGKICASLALEVVPKMMEIHSAGPRYRDYVSFFPFLYAPVSLDDPASKKYDGLGFKNVLTTYTEPKYHMAHLGSGAFRWPPPEKRFNNRDVKVICPDHRTSVVMKVEAYDLSDKGRNIPYFRREMTILDKVLKKPGIRVDKILLEFTHHQIEGIYPALSNVLIESLLEEMELVGYLQVKDGKVVANENAATKLNEFKANLSAQERAALKI